MVRHVFHGITRISTMVADAVAHPAVQLGVLTLCILWWALGGSETVLASTMSIGSFLLTQMVLNQQRRRELALQIKIDELILAKSGARDELAGIERKTEDEIEQLRAGRDIDD